MVLTISETLADCSFAVVEISFDEEERSKTEFATSWALCLKLPNVDRSILRKPLKAVISSPNSSMELTFKVRVKSFSLSPLNRVLRILTDLLMSSVMKATKPMAIPSDTSTTARYRIKSSFAVVVFRCTRASRLVKVPAHSWQRSVLRRETVSRNSATVTGFVTLMPYSLVYCSNKTSTVC